MPKASAKTKAAPARQRRRPPHGGYPRGDETRLKIITAALEVFGIHGFGGATTRMIADQAGVNLPALQYYFNGKQGVYLACADHIADRMQVLLGSAAAAIAETLAHQQPSRERLLQMLQDFLDGLADLFLREHELEKWVMFIIREQAHPTEAFDIIFDRVMRRVAAACFALVARLLERPEDDPEVRIRTLSLVGQFIFFRTGRESALRLLGWPNFEGERLQLVKAALHKQITEGLGGALTTKRGRTA